MTLKDSLKLLPMSLKRFIKVYKISTHKWYFPYRIMTEDNLNYSGLVPHKSYYDNISESDYQVLVNELKDTEWNLRDELLKYMRNDIVSL